MSGLWQLVRTTCLVVLLATNTLAQTSPPEEDAFDRLTRVDQLGDVQPTDWAFQALKSLVERYGVVTGYADQTFRGNRAMTRYEFASSLNAVLAKIDQLITSGADAAIAQSDRQTLARLQTDFSTELATLRDRVNSLESRTDRLPTQAVSTTTKLRGQAVMAVNAGGFSGDRLIAPRGAVITRTQPNATVIYRTSFDLDTSFNGTDLLKTRLVTGSDGANDNVGGFLEPNLGSTLDFSIPGRNGRISIGRAYYAFSPHPDLRVTLGPALVAPDFVDRNRYAGNSFLDFSTQALVNNFILFPRAGGAGAAVNWQPQKGALSLRGVYIAGDASNSIPENQQVIGGGGVSDIRLFPTGGGGARGGLFGDPYQGVIEVEYAPSQAFALKVEYAGGQVFGSRFNVLGVNAELALGDRMGLFGRYGYGSYPNTTLGDIHPQYWMAGLSFRDLLMPQAIAGVAVGQPLIESAVGNTTQTNFEAFYNIPINDRMRITPIIQVITNPANQATNGAIVSGTLRAVFSF
jgi:Carbohydrate-selective porin, OprB family/S-layer homology domain